MFSMISMIYVLTLCILSSGFVFPCSCTDDAQVLKLNTTPMAELLLSLTRPLLASVVTVLDVLHAAPPAPVVRLQHDGHLLCLCQ